MNSKNTFERIKSNVNFWRISDQRTRKEKYSLYYVHETVYNKVNLTCCRHPPSTIVTGVKCLIFGLRVTITPKEFHTTISFQPWTHICFFWSLRFWVREVQCHNSGRVCDWCVKYTRKKETKWTTVSLTDLLFDIEVLSYPVYSDHHLRPLRNRCRRKRSLHGWGSILMGVYREKRKVRGLERYPSPTLVCCRRCGINRRSERQRKKGGTERGFSYRSYLVYVNLGTESETKIP